MQIVAWKKKPQNHKGKQNHILALHHCVIENP